MEQQPRHRAHIHIIDLTYLRQLQSARCPSKQVADDDEDWVSQDIDRQEASRQCEDGRHDKHREQHSGDKRSNKQLALKLGVFVALLLFWQGVPGQICPEHDDDQRYSDVARLFDGACETVFEELDFVEEVLELWDHYNDYPEDHRQERRVEILPNRVT
jgi:hypothetical protein